MRLRGGEGWGVWSDALTVEAGVAGADLEARLVGIASETEGPAPHLRREFDIPGPVRKRLRVPFKLLESGGLASSMLDACLSR